MANVFPNHLVFKFPGRRCGTPLTPPIPDPYIIYQDPPQSGVKIGTRTVDTLLPALFNPSVDNVTPINDAALQSYSRQFTTDDLNWGQSQFDYVLVGIAAILPNGLIDTIELSYNQNECFTRLYTTPYNFEPNYLAAVDPQLFLSCPDTNENNTAIPCVKRFGPPTTTASGSTTLDEYLVCFQDGRLIRKFLQQVTLPCSCGPAQCQTKICVSVCVSPFVPLPNATVSISYGSGAGTLISSGVTDSTGCVTLCMGPPVTYSITFSHPTYGTRTVNQALAVNGTANVSYGNPPPGYQCCAPCGPIPNTLFLTDSNGTIPLNAIGTGLWRGCYYMTLSGADICTLFPGPDTNAHCPVIISSVQVAVVYSFSCTTNPNGYTVSRQWRTRTCSYVSQTVPVTIVTTQNFYCADLLTIGTNYTPTTYCVVASSSCGGGITNCGSSVTDSFKSGTINNCSLFNFSAVLNLGKITCTPTTTSLCNELDSPLGPDVLITA